LSYRVETCCEGFFGGEYDVLFRVFY